MWSTAKKNCSVLIVYYFDDPLNYQNPLMTLACEYINPKLKLFEFFLYLIWKNMPTLSKDSMSLWWLGLLHSISIGVFVSFYKLLQYDRKQILNEIFDNNFYRFTYSWRNSNLANTLNFQLSNLWIGIKVILEKGGFLNLKIFKYSGA